MCMCIGVTGLPTLYPHHLGSLVSAVSCPHLLLSQISMPHHLSLLCKGLQQQEQCLNTVDCLLTQEHSAGRKTWLKHAPTSGCPMGPPRGREYSNNRAADSAEKSMPSAKRDKIRALSDTAGGSPLLSDLQWSPGFCALWHMYSRQGQLTPPE